MSISFTGMGYSDGLPENINLKPLASVNQNDPEELLGWVRMTAEELVDYYAPYRHLAYENLMTYMGVRKDDSWVNWTFGSDYQDYTRNGGGRDFNLIQPVVESYVSRMTSSRATLSVLPVHTNEYKDLAAGKTAQNLIDMSFRAQRMPRLFEKAARTMLITGCAYLLVEWDPTLGPDNPNADQEQEGVVVDESGNPVEDADGIQAIKRPDPKVGDVGYKVLMPNQVYEQPQSCGHKPEWMLVYEIINVHQLREQYPELAHQIEGGDWDMSVFSGSANWFHRVKDHETLVYTLYHRATPTFPNGRFIRCTKDVVLENLDMPYPRLNRYSMLPIVRLDDTVPPGYQLPLPMTVMETGKAYNETFNRVNRNLLRNMSLNTPKWVVNQASGVRYAQLNNTTNVVGYKGDASMAPQLASPSSTPGEYFNFRGQLQQEFQVITGSSHAMNAPPPNTRAAAMLEHQEEQEFKRSEPLIRHMNDAMAEVGRIALAIMQDLYSPEDGRMLEMMGPGGTTRYLQFELSDVTAPFDVKVERTSALPESKQGRLNEAARMFQLGLIDQRQYEKLIGFSADPELATPETKAYEVQLLENDLLSRMGLVGAGQMPIPSPLEHEDHIEHLRALYPVIQSVEFRDMPQQIKSLFVGHAMAHEMFAWKRAQISLNFALRLQKLTQFPVFFTRLPAAIPVSAENRLPGEDITETRMTTPGLEQAGPTQGPDAPELV